MAKNNSLTAMFNDLPLLFKIIIHVVFGIIVSGIYRIARYFESGNTVTLVVGLIFTFTGIGNVIGWILDLYALLTSGRYTLFAD